MSKSSLSPPVAVSSPGGLPAVVLVRPQHEGNVGATARAMANMGLSELVVVEPAPEIGAPGRAFAVKAEHILDGMRRTTSLAQALAPYSRIVGTTSSRNRDLSVPILSPRELAADLARDAPSPTALVFGPEASGLNRDELARCGKLVRIPASPRQPTLNLAQAVLIITYELYLSRADREEDADRQGEAGRQGEADRQEEKAPGTPDDEERWSATAGEIAALLAQLEPVLHQIGFSRDDTFGGVLRDLGALAARSGVTRREVAILRGICRRATGTLEHLRRREPPLDPGRVRRARQ